MINQGPPRGSEIETTEITKIKNQWSEMKNKINFKIRMNRD